MIVRRLYTLLQSFVHKERSPHKLALSFCMGVYIAFSPFVGLHTAMVFVFSWLFALNLAFTWTISVFINNPWTMVPVYGSGHVIGDGIFYLLGIDGMRLNPSWVNAINAFITKYTGLRGISLWAFLIGGNLLGIAAGVLLYPFMKQFFADQVRKFKERKKKKKLL